MFTILREILYDWRVCPDLNIRKFDKLPFLRLNLIQFIRVIGIPVWLSLTKSVTYIITFDRLNF